MAFLLRSVAAATVRILYEAPFGAVISVWPDGSITEHATGDTRRFDMGVPLLAISRSGDIPTVGMIELRLRAAAALKGLRIQDL